MIKMKKLIRSLAIGSGELFPVNLFTPKRNLVFMNNLYHKVAVVSVGVALGFALGANKEAKAATIILTPTTSFGVTDQDGDEQGDSYYTGVPLHVGIRADESGQKTLEDRAFYEFNIANLSLDSNTVISSAIFQVRVDSLIAYHRYYVMQLFGYRGNGQPDASDFSQSMEADFGPPPPPVSDFETSIYLGGYYPVAGYDPVNQVNFNLDFSVAPFVNELISKNNAFAGFSIRDNDYHIGDATLRDASLIITTEPVPEPTTIFGSAIGLCLGGWLRRKKSTSQDKAKSQA
jgi:hypothetical protein